MLSKLKLHRMLALAIIASTAPNVPYFQLMIAEARQPFLAVRDRLRERHVFLCNEIGQTLADFTGARVFGQGPTR